MLGEHQVDEFFFDVVCEYFGDYVLLYDSCNHYVFCPKCLFNIRKRIPFDYLKVQVIELSTHVECFNQIDIYLYERFDKNIVEEEHLFYFHQLCSHYIMPYIVCELLQKLSHTLCSYTARFLKYVWPFHNIMHERVNGMYVVRALNDMHRRKDFVPIYIFVDCPVTHEHSENHYFSTCTKSAFIAHHESKGKRLLEKKLTNVIIAICFINIKKHVISMLIIAVVNLGLFTVFKTKTWKRTRNISSTKKIFLLL